MKRTLITLASGVHQLVPESKVKAATTQETTKTHKIKTPGWICYIMFNLRMESLISKVLNVKHSSGVQTEQELRHVNLINGFKQISGACMSLVYIVLKIRKMKFRAPRMADGAIKEEDIEQNHLFLKI